MDGGVNNDDQSYSKNETHDAGGSLMPSPRQDEMTRLGLYGVIPFIVAAVALWLSPLLLPQYFALDLHQLALIYGGALVIYFSGIGAGSVLTANSNNAPSFLPSMLITLTAIFVMLPSGTFFLSIGGAVRHLVILVLLIFLLLRDLNYVSLGLLPGWYGNLRMRVTLWIGLSMTLIMVRLYVWGFY